MNSTAEVLVQNAETAQTVVARSVVTNENSFWVLYGQHTKPAYLEDASAADQLKQRDAALAYVRQWGVCLDIGSNIGQWTRPLSLIHI